jgi:DNA-directed RNA polymerase subunit L
MNPQLDIIDSNADILTFTLSGINVSIANALRRTIISDIPMLVFRTSPNEQNKCNIITNTTRFNNEIIKQRLSCIPIHIKDIEDFPYKNYLLEVNFENNTDTTIYVTTENFVIRDTITNKLLPEEKIREIFPANDYTGYFIDFLRLRPKISDEIPSEKIHLTCEFDIGTNKEDGMFNSISTCSYGNTIDLAVQDAQLSKKKQEWKDEGKNPSEIEFESKNWLLLDGKRLFKKDSFDFVIETVGVYTNSEIVDAGCRILIENFNKLDQISEKDELEIKNADSTLSNCFDMILENEDYTIGKVLEYLFYTKFYEPKTLTYCGFKKYHPHDDYSVIRLAYTEPVEKSTIKGHLKECIMDAIQIYSKMKKDFLSNLK